MTHLALAKDLDDLRLARGERLLLGIAGAPGSGKSTLADRLALLVPGAVVLPMDGFHLDDSILEARGARSRKGAPHTFDVAGFCALLDRLRGAASVFAPRFDRDLELARAGAIEIAADVSVVIIEGNYLLHDREGWEAVRPRLDQTWYLDVPEMELARRLFARWEGYGLSAEEIDAKVNGNDLPNARLLGEGKRLAHRVISPAELD